jgi:hypothetical protein
MQMFRRLSAQPLWRSGSMARGQDLLWTDHCNLDAEGIGIILASVR